VFAVEPTISLSPFCDLFPGSSFFFRPVLAKDFRLLQNKLRGTGLLVRRVTVFAKNALDDHPHLGPDVFPDGSVDGDAPAHRLDQFLGD
jgi:hypothetical protein